MQTRPLKNAASGPARLTGLALLASLAMLVPGLTLPSLHLVSLGLFEQEYSLLAAIIAFWEKQHYSLFALVLCFTVLFPLAKIAAGLWLFYLATPNPAKLKGWVGLLSALSKWSMLDVFIIAVLVLASHQDPVWNRQQQSHSFRSQHCQVERHRRESKQA